jgi:hypothetical protein
MERVAPSARLEAQIAELLNDGFGADGETLAELGRLGARLVLQRAVDEEVAAFRVGRATSGRRLPPARAMAYARARFRPLRARSRSTCPRCEERPSGSSAVSSPTAARWCGRGHSRR